MPLIGKLAKSLDVSPWDVFEAARKSGVRRFDLEGERFTAEELHDEMRNLNSSVDVRHVEFEADSETIERIHNHWGTAA